MPYSYSSSSQLWQRQRGSRRAGRIWLLVIFCCLAAMNSSALVVISPFLGSKAPLFRGALYIAMFWDVVLLAAIWLRHNWARFILATFLVSFDAGLLLFVSDAVVRHPNLGGDGVDVIALLAATNALVATFLLAGTDIRWLSRTLSPKDE